MINIVAGFCITVGIFIIFKLLGITEEHEDIMKDANDEK